MTTMFPEEAVCGLCGEKTSIMTIASTSSFGAVDLDMRPPEMKRSTMPYWVQRCPNCGYCMGELETKASEKVIRLVGSKKYKATLLDNRFPELSNHFHCAAVIHAARKDQKEAFWSYLHAAWACDDGSNKEGGNLFRMKAIGVLEKGGRERVPVFEDANVQDTMRVDLYRRVGQFERAEEITATVLKNDVPDILRTILNFERHLNGKRDDAAHTVKEAIDHGDADKGWSPKGG